MLALCCASCGCFNLYVTFSLVSYIRLIFTFFVFDDKKTMNSKAVNRMPLYRQVRQQILVRICEDEWSQGESLPSEWDLAEQLLVSQGTVRKALTDLVAEGVLFRQQGKGTFVAPGADDWGDLSMISPGLLTESPDRLQREFLGVVRTNAPDDVAEALGVRKSAPMFRIRLLWRLRGLAVALDDVLLPVERFETLDSRWFRQSSGVWAVLMQHFGVRLRVGVEQWRAVVLGRDEMQLLGLSDQSPVLSYLRLSLDVNGQPIEWRQRYCLTDSLALTRR